MSDLNRIIESAMQLPDDERMALIARLLRSFDGVTDAESLDAWREKVNRRLAELDSGAVTPIPWPDARKMILS